MIWSTLRVSCSFPEKIQEPDCRHLPSVFQTFFPQRLSTLGQAFLLLLKPIPLRHYQHKTKKLKWQNIIIATYEWHDKDMFPQHNRIWHPQPSLSHFHLLGGQRACIVWKDAPDNFTRLCNSFSAHMWIIFRGFCLENRSLNLRQNEYEAAASSNSHL